jgi:hypothetical protein
VSDEITLVLPAQEDFRHVAHLVLGGLGARLDLTYEDLDDLQTALDGLLGCRDDDGDIRVAIEVGDGSIVSSVGPFSASEVEELASDGGGLGLRRVLDTVADSFDVEQRDGSAWVIVRKRTATTAEAAG